MRFQGAFSGNIPGERGGQTGSDGSARIVSGWCDPYRMLLLAHQAVQPIAIANGKRHRWYGERCLVRQDETDAALSASGLHAASIGERARYVQAWHITAMP